MNEVPSPVVLPAIAAHVSARVDLASREPLEVLYPGIALPASLARAVRSRQVLFLAGRTCAARAIARLDRSGGGTGVPRTPSGAPQFPAGFVGSITHTGDFVSAAVARASDSEGIGIDSEKLMSLERASKVMRHIARQEEIEETGKGIEIDRATSLTLVFSAKEALFKCLYARVGRVFGYRAARIRLDGSAASGSFEATLCVELCEGLPQGAAFRGRYEVAGDLVHTGLILGAGGSRF